MSKLTDILSKVAPLVNLVLPGSGLVLNGLLSLFGATNEDDLANKIAADPDAVLKLQQFQIEHQYDLEKILALDRASARQMQTDTIVKTGKQDWVVHFLALSTFLGFIIYLIIGSYWFPKYYDKGTMHDLLTVAMMPLMFYFGSNKK